MVAAVFYKTANKTWTVRRESIPIPHPRDGEALLRVRATGICGSDLHHWTIGAKSNRASNVGRILGHEVTGQLVEQSGASVAIKADSRVVVAPTISCGFCTPCQQGFFNLCTHRKGLGSEVPGGFAEYLLIPEKNLFKLSNSISFEEGVLIEPLAVSLSALERAGNLNERSVLVLGAGTIGLLIIKLAVRAGAKIVFASEPRTKRKLAAKRFGAAVMSPELCVESVMTATQGNGANVVFDCVGDSGSVIDLAITTVSRNGIIVGVGRFASRITISRMDSLINKSVDFRGSQGYGLTFQSAIDLIESRKLTLSGLITHKVKLDKVEHGFDLAKATQSNAIKVVVTQP